MARVNLPGKILTVLKQYALVYKASWFWAYRITHSLFPFELSEEKREFCDHITLIDHVTFTGQLFFFFLNYFKFYKLVYRKRE